MRFVDFESYKPLSRISGNNTHEVGILTELAYCLAAQAQGFCNQAHYWAWLRVYAERKRLG
jgi:hypothetical protein